MRPATAKVEPGSSAPPARKGTVTPIQAELIRVQRHLLESGNREAYLALQHRRPWISWGYVAASWALIFAAWALTVWVSPWFAPLSLLVIASRQRSLGNNLHDAAHGNVVSSPWEWVVQVLLAAPMAEELGAYRKAHLAHHANLGNPRTDPDFLDPFREVEARTPLRLYWWMLGSARAWRGNFLGDLPALGARARLWILAFWVVLLGALALLAGPGPAGLFLLLWLGSRATAYHALKSFTELADHVGLLVDSSITYTRNSPDNLLALIVHPHNDNYHLTHHLAPRIPMPNLPRFHALLSGMDEYREGHHCDGYFFGEYPVIRSWITPRQLVDPQVLQGPRRTVSGRFIIRAGRSFDEA